MLLKMLKCVLVLLTIIFKAQAFWWQSTTTETPAINVKHIPLTYYRTYTYQPLTGGPFSFPFAYGGSAQTPVLNGGRYEQYHFPTNQHIAQRQFLPQAPPPPPPTTTTTATTTTQPTTTTTTTTPAPTTTTSTTTTTTTSKITSQQSTEPLINSGGGTFGPVPQYESSIYPTYNRRVYMNSYNDGSYYRPHYPYPDYAAVTKSSSMFQNVAQRPPHLQFVPCMCPVGVGGLPIVDAGTTRVGPNNSAHNLYMPQLRSNENNDDSDMNLPLDDEESKEKRSNFNEAEEQQIGDDKLVNDSDSQSEVLETNKIDSDYRQSKINALDVVSL